jgi:UDP-glucose 4-epimerase
MFRFAQVIGRHEHRGVIIDFIKKLNEDNKVLRILGDGKQEKSYFDVSDCVNGFIEIPKRDKNKSVEIYNLGNTEVVTVTRLAEILCDEIGVNPKFEYTGGDRGWLGDTPYCILSIEKSLRVGWVPKYDCEESIRRAVRYVNDLK